MDENDLLHMLTTDPERGVGQLIRAYGPAVHKICGSILAGFPQEEVEEAEADVFVNIWKHRESIRIGDNLSLKGYLYTTARNVSRDRLRKAKPALCSVEEAMEDGIELRSPESVDDSVVQEWLQSTLLASLEELGEPERSVFLERYYLGRSVKNIATGLDLPAKKVENILYRGKARLRAILDRKGVTSYE